MHCVGEKYADDSWGDSWCICGWFSLQGSSVFGVVDEEGNKGDDVEIGYGGGNGVFSSIYILLASESGIQLLEVEWIKAQHSKWCTSASFHAILIKILPLESRGQESSRFGVVNEEDNIGDDEWIDYGGGNGVFSSIYILLAMARPSPDTGSPIELWREYVDR